MMTYFRIVPTTLAVSVLAAAPLAASSSLTPVTVGTSWSPQAEHGGYYQAVANGYYAGCGLDVSIVPGGHGMNNRQRMLSGDADFYIGGDTVSALRSIANGKPIVTVATMFQELPAVLMTHPGVAESLDDLKGQPISLTNGAFNNYYQWLIHNDGFSADQRVGYTSGVTDFINDPSMVKQGYASSEPYQVAMEGGFMPDIFSIADAGYNTYGSTVETRVDVAEQRPEVVGCFVQASIAGWESYLNGDNSAANAMIKADNPDQTDGQLDYAVETMLQRGTVFGGDAQTNGVGTFSVDRVEGLYRNLVNWGVMEDGVDVSRYYDTRFVGADQPAPADAS